MTDERGEEINRRQHEYQCDCRARMAGEEREGSIGNNVITSVNIEHGRRLHHKIIALPPF